MTAAGAPLERPAPAALDLGLEPVGAVDTPAQDPWSSGSASPASAGTVVLARFQVYGIPRAKGSKVPFLDPRTGQARIKEQNDVLHRSWEQDVASHAARLADQLAGPLDGALALEVTFRFPMPQSRRKSDRLAGTVLKTTAPDTSKLVRSIEDSMEAAGLIRNDARFAVELATKVEVLDGWTGADIVIRRAS